MLSIIIPALNEASVIGHLLDTLQPLRERGHEVILVDGGSDDTTRAIAEPLVDYLVESAAGRAMQMNAGAAIASGSVLWFLHADSTIPGDAGQLLESIADMDAPVWGRFDVRLSGSHRLLRIVEAMMNYRSRITGIATGDQAIFISRDLFQAVNGYPDQPLMEDIEISKALKRTVKPVCVPTHVVTSSRRWEQHGILKTIVKMWRLRLAYYTGTSAEKLVMRYD
jgi:rSAM/selenodomain-associated transferase 2